MRGGAAGRLELEEEGFGSFTNGKKDKKKKGART